jgi:hypothetical protein
MVQFSADKLCHARTRWPKPTPGVTNHVHPGRERLRGCMSNIPDESTGSEGPRRRAAASALFLRTNLNLGTTRAAHPLVVQLAATLGTAAVLQLQHKLGPGPNRHRYVSLSWPPHAKELSTMGPFGGRWYRVPGLVDAVREHRFSARERRLKPPT